MTPLFDQLEDQLRDAARDRVAQHEHRRGPRRRPGRVRRWLGGGRRALPVVIGVAITFAVVAVVIVLVARHPSPGTPAASGTTVTIGRLKVTDRANAGLAVTMDVTAVEDRPVCTTVPRAATGAVSGMPSRALLNALAVLRMPRTAEDRLPRWAARGLSARYYAADVRRATTFDGITYFLVPIRDDPAVGQPTTACLTAQTAAVDRVARRLHGALSGEVRHDGLALVARNRSMRRKHPFDEVCLVGGGGTLNTERSECDGITADALRHGQVPGTQPMGRTSGAQDFFAIEPDAVAKVTIAYPASHERVSGRVHGNILLFPVPSGVTLTGTAIYTFTDRAGRRVGRITVPSITANCRLYQCASSTGTARTTP